jgi:hypothetical protein
MNSGTAQAPMVSSYSWQSQPSNGGLQGTVPSASIAPVGNRVPPTLTPGMAHTFSTRGTCGTSFRHCGLRSPPTTITT